MKLQTQVPLQTAKFPIDYDSKIVAIGSCFSEHIGNKLGACKFRITQNPFGILFHPKAIETLVTEAINQVEYTENDVFLHNEQWHSFKAHSALSGTNKTEVLEHLNLQLQYTRQALQEASHVILTLGTAWVYKNTETQNVVANCHKLPQKTFQKELLSVNAIRKALENIVTEVKAINPNVVFVFTVSPVRHIKDGMVENMRSKSHVLTAIHHFIEHQKNERLYYFPSYEIMMDELRDYRFYAKDMIHPSSLAVDYIWEQFKTVWINNGAFPIMKAVTQIQQRLQHKPFNPTSEAHKLFLLKLEADIKAIKACYPFLKF